MTPTEFLSEFRKSQRRGSLRVTNYPLYLDLRKPLNLDYVVSGLLDKDDRAMLERRRPFALSKRIRKPHVTATFRYEMWGRVAGKEGCFESDCRLHVNSSGNYLERSEPSANLGWGRYTGQEFLLYLEVHPEIAKNMILRRVLAPSVEERFEETEAESEDSSWMRLSLSIFNAYGRNDISDACFSIGDAYFSSVFSPLQFL